MPSRSRAIKQVLLAHVPQRKAEHAVEMSNELIAVFLVEVNDDFGVATSLEMVALRLQISAQLAKVVDLAVADHPDGSVLVRDWLVTTAQIDDRKSAHAHRERTIRIAAFVIRTAMDRHFGHAREQYRRASGAGRGREFRRRRTSVGWPFG